MVSGGKLAQRRECPAQFRDDKLLEPVARRVVDVIALAEVLYADGDVGHTSA